MSKHNWKLSPSDFAFLWEECKRCFYLKVVNGYVCPRTIMPKIFTVIDNEMKNFFSGEQLENIVSRFPSGVVQHGKKGHGHSLFFFQT